MHVTIENLANYGATAWVFCGIPKQRNVPDNGWLTDGVYKYPYAKDASGRGIRVLVTMPAGHAKKLEFTEDKREPDQFKWHPALAQDIELAVPRFWMGGVAGEMSLQQVTTSEATSTYLFRHWFPTYRVTVDVWCTAYSTLSSVDFVAHAVYGTTENDGQAQAVNLPALSMETGLPMSVDFARRNGHAVSRLGNRSVVAITTDSTRWHRASTFELRGSIHAAANQAREQGLQMFGLFSEWDGHWMALGRVPKSVQATETQNIAHYHSYKNQTFVGYAAPRPRCQPRESGTTGEQADFGAASDLAVTCNGPWEIHDALWQCQSYVQRPVNNRDGGGVPMRAVDHPKAETLNQRPDLSFGLQDRLGWPGQNQIGWIPSAGTVLWTTSDDQHRSDNFLHATIALTADPALEQLVRAHVELDKTDVHVRRGLQQSPRAVGRLALTRANQMWLGLADDSTMVIGIETALRTASMATLPADKPIRIIGGYEQAKYGWVSSQNQPVIGWQPWQETIVVIGIMAASRQLLAAGNDALAIKYHDIAMGIANVVHANAWQQVDSQRFHAYAIRWNGGDAFAPTDWPRLSYNDSWNDNVYISTACSPWTEAASVLLGLSKQVITSPAQARWWAI